MNKNEVLAVALEALSRELHNTKRPIDGILADRRVKTIQVWRVRTLLKAVEGVEKNLNTLSINYYRAAAMQDNDKGVSA